MSDGQLVEKWKPTGLLDGLENEKRENHLAESLEGAYQYLIEIASEYKEDNEESLEFQETRLSDDFQWAAGLILPAISRAYNQDEKSLEPIDIDVDEISEIDGEHFAMKFLEMSEKYEYRDMVRDLDDHHNVDGEAEVCQMFVEYYLAVSSKQ